MFGQVAIKIICHQSNVATPSIFVVRHKRQIILKLKRSWCIPKTNFNGFHLYWGSYAEIVIVKAHAICRKYNTIITGIKNEKQV